MENKSFAKKAMAFLLIMTPINIAIALFVGSGADAFQFSWFDKKEDQVFESLYPHVLSNRFPLSLNWGESDEGPVQIEYTLNEKMQAHVQSVFNRHRPDFGSAVALDAETGEILTMVSFSRSDRSKNLAVQATFPAASIFKIVTAAAAMEKGTVVPSSRIGFGGGNHTLYKKNVEGEGRWRRFVTVKEAFARSINTVFAKLGLFFVGPEALREYADRFLFDQKIESDIPIEPGRAHIPDDDRWAVAEAASGYTRKNTMSPIQGALMAAVVANDGTMPVPHLIRSVSDSSGDVIYKSDPRPVAAVVDSDTAQQLRQLMGATITQGTSRKSFKRLIRGAKKTGLELGGKTGSLTGVSPQGKYDWFVGYGRMNDRKVALSVMTINKEIWRVRSSQVAADYFQHFFNISSPVRRVASYTKGRRSKRR